MFRHKSFVNFSSLFISFIICIFIIFALKYDSESEGVLNAEIINFGKFTFPKKEWQVKFTKSIDEKTLSNDSVYIEDGDGKKLKVKLSYSKRKKIMIIKPLEEYLAWQKYTISITDKIKTTNGQKLGKPINKDFDMLKNTFNSGMHFNYCGFKSTGVVNSEEDFYNELKYGLESFKEKIELKLNNTDVNEYNIDILNEICDDIPLLNYGFKSIKGETIKDSFGNEKMIVSFQYRLPIDKLKEMKKVSENEANKIIKKLVKPEMTDIQKELVIHDYIVNNCVYDREEKKYPAEDYTDYGVFVKKIAVCEGYAKAMYRILNNLDIRCIYIVGEAKRPHAWNVVQINNKYYQLDITWNDMPSIDEGEVLIHKYFNIDNELMMKNHTWIFSDYPICDSNEFAYRDLKKYSNVNSVKLENVEIIENQDQFENSLKEAILNKEKKIVFKILDYSKNIYDVEKSVNNIVNKNGLDFYGKFSYTHPSELEDGSVEYVEVIFKSF